MAWADEKIVLLAEIQTTAQMGTFTGNCPGAFTAFKKDKISFHKKITCCHFYEFLSAVVCGELHNPEIEVKGTRLLLSGPHGSNESRFSGNFFCLQRIGILVSDA